MASSPLVWIYLSRPWHLIRYLSKFSYKERGNVTKPVELIMSPSTTTHSSSRPKIWWSATLFIVGVHIATIVGVYLQPPSVAKRASVLLSLIVWQFSGFGYVIFFFFFFLGMNFTKFMPSITIGYHRLYAHKAFRASLGLRVILAILGASACQGSIKVCYD